MRKKYWIALALLFIVPGLMFTTSCAKKAVTSGPMEKMSAEDEAAKKAAEEAARKKQEEMARQRAMEEQRLKEERMAREKKMKEEAKQAMFEQEDIHFDFDKYNLKPDAQEILKEKAAFLKENPSVRVTIEGHCDERGSNEYNLALGDRRANSARAFLINLGIGGFRLNTVSYGEERPIDPGHNEAAWAKNRRAHFVIE